MCFLRKNVRKWIESQMEGFVRIFCFEVKIYKYSTIYKHSSVLDVWLVLATPLI